MEMLRSGTESVNNHSQVTVCSPSRDVSWPCRTWEIQPSRCGTTAAWFTLRFCQSSSCQTPQTSGELIRPSVHLQSLKLSWFTQIHQHDPLSTLLVVLCLKGSQILLLCLSVWQSLRAVNLQELCERSCCRLNTPVNVVNAAAQSCFGSCLKGWQ